MGWGLVAKTSARPSPSAETRERKKGHRSTQNGSLCGSRLRVGFLQCGVGKGFAEAMAELKQLKKTN